MTEAPPRPTFLPPVGLPRRGTVRFVDVLERRLLVVDGQGEPGGPAFREAVGALFATAYTLHFALKAVGAEPGPVGALEGLWERTGASASMGVFDQGGDPADWVWRAMLPVPDAAADADVTAAIAATAAREPTPALGRVRLVRWTEGRCVEGLHVGPYATETETIARMMTAIERHGLRPHGRHHEIYLGDPRRAAPERLRTVLRHPVA